jgi:chaperone modulatory protein CbpM
MGVPIHTGDIVVEHQTYTLIQVSVICGVYPERITELVSYGIVDPGGMQEMQWRFSEFAMNRLKKAVRLHRDLGIDQQGLALTLELLDEIDRLRSLVDRQDH